HFSWLGAPAIPLPALITKRAAIAHRTHRQAKPCRSSARPRRPLPRSTMHDADRMAIRNRKRTSVAVPILLRKGELALATRQGRLGLKLIAPSMLSCAFFADYASGAPFDCLRLSEMDFI